MRARAFKGMSRPCFGSQRRRVARGVRPLKATSKEEWNGKTRIPPYIALRRGSSFLVVFRRTRIHVLRPRPASSCTLVDPPSSAAVHFEAIRLRNRIVLPLSSSVLRLLRGRKGAVVCVSRNTPAGQLALDVRFAWQSVWGVPIALMWRSSDAGSTPGTGRIHESFQLTKPHKRARRYSHGRIPEPSSREGESF